MTNYLDDLQCFGGLDDAWKCQRCHKVVRLYDANNETERAVMLQAHRALNCRTDPFLDVVFGA